MGNNKNRHLYTALLSVTVLFLMLLLFSGSNMYSDLRYALTDFKWRMLAEPEKADSSFMVIAIDDASISYFADRYQFTWPWPRQFYGIVLDYLNKSGAETVVFDMHFTEPDMERLEISGTASDEAFGKAVSQFGGVVLGAMLTDTGLGTGMPDSSWTLRFENRQSLPIPVYDAIRFPVATLGNGLDLIGTTHFITDSDGICRRLPLMVRVDNDYYPQLGFAAYLQSSGDSILSYDTSRRLLKTRRQSIQLDKEGNFPVFWYGPGGESNLGTYRFDSFHAVFLSALQQMSGTVPVIPPGAFKGKKIVICATAGGLLDLKPTPFTSVAPYPGGEIHLTVWNNLSAGDRVRTAYFPLIALLTLAFTLFLTNVIMRRPFGQSALVSLSGATAAILISLALFSFSAINMDELFPILGILLTTVTASMYRTLTEGKAKRQIRNLFSRYLSSDVISMLMEHPDRVDLQGAEITGTVLFTDLQGFTTFSEHKSPKEVIGVLNSYFETISSIVLDFGGLLDKYTGDGIMAIFGAPVPREDHARAACEVILKFRESEVNKLIPSPGGAILTRIGISSGPMVVGNLGSTRRMDFTAVGDTVNLSARLEGVNKSYGTTNIMSEFTWEFVKDDYIFRELDYIRVKGKVEPIRVFTLIGRPEDVSQRQLEIEELFKRAMEHYRQREWRQAIDAFEWVLDADPDDKPAAAFIKRCRLLKNNPDLVDDAGVFTFKTK